MSIYEDIEWVASQGEKGQEVAMRLLGEVTALIIELAQAQTHMLKLLERQGGDG